MQLKPVHAAAYVTVLKRIQSAEETSTGGGRLRDVDGDGIFEYEEIGACGAGPNCEGTVFKVRKDRRGIYLFFEGGYADFKYIPNFYIESGRASCCSWEHHVYKAPSGERGITENDFLYSITVGGFAAKETAATPCHISKKRNGKWIAHATRNKHLLALCELYGPDYVVNPPGVDEEQ